MALQLQVSSRGIPSTIRSLWPTKQSNTTVSVVERSWSSSSSSSSCVVGPITMMMMMKKKNSSSRRRMGSVRPVRSSLETAAGGPVEVMVGTVTAVDKDTFWPIVNAAGDKTVVLDMYTQWYLPISNDSIVVKNKKKRNLWTGRLHAGTHQKFMDSKFPFLRLTLLHKPLEILELKNEKQRKR